MKEWKKDGVGPSESYYTPRQQSPFGKFCSNPSCWSDCDVRPVKQEDKPDVVLCRYHRKHHGRRSS